MPPNARAGVLLLLSPPKEDWVATVEGHPYEVVYTYSEKNYADFCQHFFWG